MGKKIKNIHPEALEYIISKIKTNNQYQLVYRLYLEGWDYNSIALKIGYSTRQIERIICVLNEEMVIFLSEQIVGCNIRPIKIDGIDAKLKYVGNRRSKAWAG